jgi:hypothetical protein
MILLTLHLEYCVEQCLSLGGACFLDKPLDYLRDSVPASLVSLVDSPEDQSEEYELCILISQLTRETLNKGVNDVQELESAFGIEIPQVLQ